MTETELRKLADGLDRIDFQSFINYPTLPLATIGEAANALRDVAAELTVLRAKVKSQAEALNGLVHRLDEVHADPAYQSVWTLSQLHNGPYKGPQYVEELEAARRAAQEAGHE